MEHALVASRPEEVVAVRQPKIDNGIVIVGAYVLSILVLLALMLMMAVHIVGCA